MAFKLAHSTTVDMEVNWHQFVDVQVTGLIHQDELERWNDLVDETVYGELETGWMNEKSPVYAWAEPLHDEVDTAMNPLPSPSEEQWLDLKSEYFFSSDDVPGVSSWESAEPECDNCIVSVSENVQQDVESAPCNELADVVDLLLQHDDLSMLIDQVGTVDSSQLELLLTESTDIGNMMASNLDMDSSVIAEELHCSLSESENDDNSDWSYSGQKERRYSSRSSRLARSKPYRRQNKTVKFERKKEQNKNAATRYRERKRNEERDNEVECERLEIRNHELRDRVKAMSHEVDVLRKLIVDIFRNGSPSD